MGGSKKVPYYGWLEFGGTVGKGRESSHISKKKAVVAGSAHRRYIQGGRYIYPTFAANRDAIYKALDKAMADLVRSVGLEVKSGG